jgi:hypothetical protein
MTTTTAPTTVPPCPEWCAPSAGHDLDDLGSTGFRVHSAHPPDTLVSIVGCPMGTSPETLAFTEQPFIYYDVIDEHGSAADAREFAGRLLAPR